jgi:hypothetical protein
VVFPSLLFADLHALSAAVDDPGTDIAGTLAQLSDAAAAAVESYLGLSVEITGGADAFQLSTMSSDRSEIIGSSVLIPVTANAAILPGAVTNLVLYAATPGAFIDMAADLAWMTGRDTCEFHLDQYLTSPQPAPAARSVRALSVIDQAVGVLIDRGRTPEQATQDLALLAAREDADLPAAAASVLDELT